MTLSSEVEILFFLHFSLHFSTSAIVDHELQRYQTCSRIRLFFNPSDLTADVAGRILDGAGLVRMMVMTPETEFGFGTYPLHRSKGRVTPASLDF
jgi:hypothetical protein